jgi:nucleoid-associated protein YgaU
VALVSSSSGEAVMQRLPPEGAPPVMQKVGAVEAPAGEGTWTVAAGDHLWSIAERVLADAWARPPADHEVVPYWEQVVAANRDRLADRDNPDLIFPGQQLVVPAPPPAP